MLPEGPGITLPPPPPQEAPPAQQPPPQQVPPAQQPTHQQPARPTQPRTVDCHLGIRWYTVFVGRLVGVFNSWDEVQNSTSGVPGQSQRRYGSRNAAVIAFNQAVANGTVHVVNMEPVPQTHANIPVLAIVQPETPPAAHGDVIGAADPFAFNGTEDDELEYVGDVEDEPFVGAFPNDP